MSPTDEALAAFVAFQSQTCTYSSLKTYLYGVRHWVLGNGHEFIPWTQRRAVYTAMRGVRRVFGDFVDRKLAVTPALLLHIRNCLDVSTHNDAMLWCAMLVAFWGLFRKDNITVGKASAFNPRSNLTRGDFSIKNGTLWVRVRHSKTNQFRQRCHWVPLVAIPGHPLCPVAAVLRVFKLHGGNAHPNEPMFTFEALAGLNTLITPMTHRQFVYGFKACVQACGLDWTKYSGHSFRRGGATFAFNLGVDPNLIKLQGDWVSDAYLIYDETTDKRRLELPRAMAQAVEQGILHHGPRMEK